MMNNLALTCYRLVFVIAFIALVSSCSDDPVVPATGVEPLSRGVYVLCEGLWKMDNSTLVRYNPATGTVENNFYQKANPALRLGDTSNDIVLQGDTAFVAVTTSRSVEIFRVSTGQWLHRIRFGNGKMPRHIAFTPNDAYVSNFTDNSLTRINPHTFSILNDAISAGPAVEGVAYAGGYIFAANSGLGSLQIDSPMAGTLTVIRVGSDTTAKTLPAAPNVSELLASPDGTKLYAVSYAVTGRPDIVPALIEYDVFLLTETRRWNAPEISSACFSRQGDTLFFLSEHGVDALDIRTVGSAPATIVYKNNNDDHWYTLAQHPTEETLWIGNARGYTTEGEVIIADKQGVYKKQFNVGINPTAIVFFGYK